MIALFSVLLFASDAAATTVQAEPAAPAAIEAPKPKAKEERKVCKREANTGSNMPGKRICLTAKEWREREEQDSW